MKWLEEMPAFLGKRKLTGAMLVQITSTSARERCQATGSACLNKSDPKYTESSVETVLRGLNLKQRKQTVLYIGVSFRSERSHSFGRISS